MLPRKRLAFGKLQKELGNLGDTIKITAIATGFGDNFDNTKRKVTDVLNTRPEPLVRPGAKVDYDTPAFTRKEQSILNNAPKQREMPRRNADMFVDDEQFDIPTFLRRRVD